MKIVFYTLIYKIQSKFTFDKYIQWGEYLLNNLGNNKLYIITDEDTKDLLEDLCYDRNIEFIIIELKKFYYYRYRLQLINNTNKKLFPHHDIDFKLILIWLERHLLLKEIIKKEEADFYSYIDWGYFRDNKIYNDFANNILDKLKKDKIYFALINDNLIELKKYINVFNSNKESEIEKLLENNMLSIGGGFSIIPKKLIRFYLEKYRETLEYFLENTILFKDDQTILFNLIFKKENIDNFELITEVDSQVYITKYKKEISNCKNKFIENYYKSKIRNGVINENNDNWFPFKKLLTCDLINLSFNDEISDLFRKLIILEDDMEEESLKETGNYKIYYKGDNKYIYLKNREIDLGNISEILINCLECENNTSINLENTSEYCNFKIV